MSYGSGMLAIPGGGYKRTAIARCSIR